MQIKKLDQNRQHPGLNYCVISSYLKQQVEVVQESLSRLSRQTEVVSHWQQSVTVQLKHHLDLLQLTNMAAGPSAPKVTKWVRVIQSAQQTHRNECETSYQRVSVLQLHLFSVFCLCPLAAL